jgi:hypothetical protein
MYNFFNLRNLEEWLLHGISLHTNCCVSMEERLLPGGPQKIGGLVPSPNLPLPQDGPAHLPPPLAPGHRSPASSAHVRTSLACLLRAQLPPLVPGELGSIGHPCGRSCKDNATCLLRVHCVATCQAPALVTRSPSSTLFTGPRACTPHVERNDYNGGSGEVREYEGKGVPTPSPFFPA